MWLLTNHINSTRHAKLDNRSPYEMANSDDMKCLMELLGLRQIPPDEVHLTVDLLG